MHLASASAPSKMRLASASSEKVFRGCVWHLLLLRRPSQDALGISCGRSLARKAKDSSQPLFKWLWTCKILQKSSQLAVLFFQKTEREVGTLFAVRACFLNVAVLIMYTCLCWMPSAFHVKKLSLCETKTVPCLCNCKCSIMISG